MRTATLATLLACVAVGLAAPLQASAGLSAFDIKVNYLRAPIGLDLSSLVTFGWELRSSDETARGVVSAGATLSVTKLAHDGAALETHVAAVADGTTSFVPLPAGVTLASDTAYTVSVTYAGGAAVSSTFSTGLLQQSDWSTAAWITAPDKWQATQMRSEFAVPAGAVTRAMLYVAVPGYAQVELNGKDVDGDAGTRTWTQYDKRVLYHCYDVKDMLMPGTNALGLHVGKGWYGHDGYGPPAVRAILKATVGGKAVTTATSMKWMQVPSPVSMDDEYNGVTYDARNETPGWSSAGFKLPSSAVPATKSKSFKLDKSLITAANFAPVKVMHTLTAGWMREPAPGVYVFDFNQNIAGWVKLKVRGPAGMTVRLRHAETLMHPPYGPRDGNIYIGNLRGAKAIDTYTLKGDPAGEEFQPTFTQHGFRYVELVISGVANPEPPTQDMLTAINIRSGLAQTGTAASSDLMMNDVQHLFLWGQADNLMMIPTDCDQRDERLGWTGDSALTAHEASLNYDMGAFFHNWAQMIDDNSPNGAIGCTVPGGPGAGNIAASKSCDASWTSVYPSVLYATYKTYGDKTLPKKHWTSLCRFMDNEIKKVSTGIKAIFANFGDWVPPTDAKCPTCTSGTQLTVPGGAEAKVDKLFTAGFSFVGDLKNMAIMAKAIGKTADATKYSTAAEKYGKEWHAAWFDSAKGVYAKGGQTAQTLGLELDVGTAATKKSVLAALVANVLAHSNHTTCGIIGWKYECKVLSDNGYGDLAWALMTQKTYPSLGFEILNPDEPSTTIWELWNSPYEGPGMNSRNHIMFGAPGFWVYEYSGGLTQAADSVGFATSVLTPPAALIMNALANGTTNANISAAPWMGSAFKRTQRGNFGLEWNLPQPGTGGSSTCASVNQGTKIVLSCGASTIKAVTFAEYGTPAGACPSLTAGKCKVDLSTFTTPGCVGKTSCSIDCSDSGCTVNGKKVGNGTDPCYGTKKKLAASVSCAGSPSKAAVTLSIDVTIAANSKGVTNVPMLGAADITIDEGGVAVWKGGKYVAGVAGITGASEVGDAVAVTHGSGEFHFVRSS